MFPYLTVQGLSIGTKSTMYTNYRTSLGTAKDRDEMSKLLASQIQQKLNCNGTSDVVAVRHLNSKDIAVHLTMVAAAKQKLDDEGSVKVLGSSASVN
jgi:hypothetical protein